MESYNISGNTLSGPVEGTIMENGDIEWNHGYTTRREEDDFKHLKPGQRFTWNDS
jgi:hypothetical protein